MADDAHDGWTGGHWNHQDNRSDKRSSTKSDRKRLIFIISCTVALVFVLISGGVIVYARYVQLRLRLPETNPAQM